MCLLTFAFPFTRTTHVARASVRGDHLNLTTKLYQWFRCSLPRCQERLYCGCAGVRVQPSAPDVEAQSRRASRTCPTMEADRRRALVAGLVPLGEDVPCALVRVEAGWEVASTSATRTSCRRARCSSTRARRARPRNRVVAGLDGEPRRRTVPAGRGSGRRRSGPAARPLVVHWPKLPGLEVEPLEHARRRLGARPRRGKLRRVRTGRAHVCRTGLGCWGSCSRGRGAVWQPE